MGGVFERGEKRKEKEEEIQHHYTLLIVMASVWTS